MPEDFIIERKILKKYIGKSKNPVIPDGVKKIAPDAFASADIKTVEIPETVRIIEENAFIGSKIETVIIPESVNHIGEGAFSLCEKLRSFTALNSKMTFGTKGIDSVFCVCKKLSEINLPDDMPRGTGIYSGACKVKKVELLPTETEIKRMAFYQCLSLEEIKIPEGVTKIGGGAFMDCVNLKKIVLPESVVEIGTGAFKNCFRLRTVVFPENIEKIGADTFMDCDSLGARTLSKLEKIYDRIG